VSQQLLRATTQWGLGKASHWIMEVEACNPENPCSLVAKAIAMTMTMVLANLNAFNNLGNQIVQYKVVKELACLVQTIVINHILNFVLVHTLLQPKQPMCCL
jgi:hypothetical protein